MSNVDDVEPLIGEPLHAARARRRRRVLGQPFDAEQEARRQSLREGYLAGQVSLYDLEPGEQVHALQQHLDIRIAAAKAARGET